MQRTTPRTLLLTAITVVTLSITGCVADPEVTDNQPDGGSAPTHVEEITFPDTEVGQTSRWVLDEINGSNAINKQDWYPRVSPEMSEDIPVDSLVGTLNTELRPSMPYVPSDYDEPEENYAITRLTPDLTAEPVDLHLKTDATGRISALWYEYVEDEGTTEQPDNGDKEEDSENDNVLGQ
ncbi:MAG TPA: Cpe/LpqF family protein [Candidatus Yaniella excrementigallinarum]|nr:Cpe/LpqF family protein [Candidatus Yaniella excrementigallinarum]